MQPSSSFQLTIEEDGVSNDHPHGLIDYPNGQRPEIIRTVVHLCMHRSVVVDEDEKNQKITMDFLYKTHPPHLVQFILSQHEHVRRVKTMVEAVI